MAMQWAKKRLINLSRDDLVAILVDLLLHREASPGGIRVSTRAAALFIVVLQWMLSATAAVAPR
jgi:hypothetical protein